MNIFNNAGLIGLGLIGGSLGHAIKKHGLAKNIIGYTKSRESSIRAVELGIIDNIANSITDLTENCDIIIICTPLSTYEAIFQEIAPALQGKNCIITDVGSLKFPVIELARKYFELKNLAQIVPAHPIAGTEKTGVESGFAELFDGKKTIITPLEKTDPRAIGLVSKLWHACGSKTEIMEAGLHDKIYAEVSHLPQFLAYCYAGLLLEKNKIIKDFLDLKNNQDFWKFSRICASDPAIWIDIFEMNKKNISASLNKFTNEIQNLISEIEFQDSSNDNWHGSLLINSLPAIISASLIKCSPHSQYAGTGFKDLTSYMSNHIEHSDNSVRLIFELLSNAQELMQYIKNNDHKKALDFMQKAVDYYGSLRG